MVIGNGYFGNLNLTLMSSQGTKGGKFVVWDSANVTDGSNVGIRYSALSVQPQIIIGNISSSATIIRSGIDTLSVGGGASANTFSWTSQGLGAIAGRSSAMFVGQPNTTVALGNVTIAGCAGAASQIISYNGSNIGNASAHYVQHNLAGNIVNAAGVSIQFTGNGGTGGASPTNVYGLYMGGGSLPAYANATNSSYFRSATNYYFLKNDDAVAQNQLGSLRAYHTFQSGGNTSGTWDINKDNGQVQAISTTGNITIGSYTNFVTTANDGTNNDNQTDTVTLIIEQGATPYTVTMPTGNTAIRYAGGVNTVTSTANTTTMIAITAFRTAANATGYLTTISPAFS
jgi:hypothetical protein